MSRLRKMLATKEIVSTIVVGTVLPAIVHAHGGGLNAEGCHYNRKTGDYHCHQPPRQGSSSRRGILDARRSPGTKAARCTVDQILYMTKNGLSDVQVKEICK